MDFFPHLPVRSFAHIFSCFHAKLAGRWRLKSIQAEFRHNGIKHRRPMVILMISRGRLVTINSALKSNYNRQTLTLTILSLSVTISPTKRLQDSWRNKIKSKVGGES